MAPAEINGKEVRGVSRRLAAWRWVFLCALTSLATLLFMWVRGGLFLDFIRYPHRAGFVGAVYTIDTVFLLFGSPLFFRRLRGLAILAWLVAVAAVIWSALPVF